MKQKSENQKALPKFLGILVVAGLIGGVLGGLSGAAGYFWEGHDDLGGTIAHLLGVASPWALALAMACRISSPAPPSSTGNDFSVKSSNSGAIGSNSRSWTPAISRI